MKTNYCIDCMSQEEFEELLVDSVPVYYPSDDDKAEFCRMFDIPLEDL